MTSPSMSLKVPMSSKTVNCEDICSPAYSLKASKDSLFPAPLSPIITTFLVEPFFKVKLTQAPCKGKFPLSIIFTLYSVRSIFFI